MHATLGSHRSATPGTDVIDTTFLRRNISTRLSANCGCGARYATIEDGEAHAIATGHTLHFTGEIRSK